jgi:hypothetical protein
MGPQYDNRRDFRGRELDCFLRTKTDMLEMDDLMMERV